MGIAVVDNLRGFATSRPPLVVFMVCLGLFAFVLLTLSLYVQNHEYIPNPDVSEDWNMFLDSFAGLEFCILGNSSDIATTMPVPDKTSVDKRAAGGSGPSSSPAPRVHDETSPVYSTEGPRWGNYSVSMLVTLHPTKDFLNIPHNNTHLIGTVLGSELGIKGTGSEEPINFQMEISNDYNRTRCSSVHGGCDEVKVYTCVYFQAPTYVFPASKSPPECSMVNDTGPSIDYSAQVKAHNPSEYSTFYCKSRPYVKVRHHLDPQLTVWLSLHDRSVINLHLLHTSYFLFVMVITLFCYATVRGRPLLTKNTHAQTSHANHNDTAHESLLSDA